MKSNGRKHGHHHPLTLADLVATVSETTHNDRLSALIVAHLVNSRRIHLEGVFRGKHVVIR